METYTIYFDDVTGEVERIVVFLCDVLNFQVRFPVRVICVAHFE